MSTLVSLSLAPETARLIQDHLSGGIYRSADELVQAALLALDIATGNLIADEEDEQALDEALAQLERGEGIPWEQVRESLRKKYNW